MHEFQIFVEGCLVDKVGVLLEGPQDRSEDAVLAGSELTLNGFHEEHFDIALVYFVN